MSSNDNATYCKSENTNKMMKHGLKIQTSATASKIRPRKLLGNQELDL